MEIIEKEIKTKFGTWKVFCKESGQHKTNFKRRIQAYINKLNKWLKPLGLEVVVKKGDINHH